ncbi:cytochrome c oxidase subunit II [Novosphingobium sp. M1R2S20]|uniref:Cytochrome c oxidase subunit 2 n=1 Tax=Novosphingobium rhizovicinum TaxID=3228928 RepID=A0ABV3RD88_9SPHN
MKSGDNVRAASRAIRALGLSVALATLPYAAIAAAPAPAAPVPAIAAPAAEASAAPDRGATAVQNAGNPLNLEGPTADVAASAAYTPMTPTPGVGMPVDGGIGLQKQFSPFGEYGHWIHDAVLMPLIAIITLLVLLLLVIVVVRFNRRANPIASRTSHNTLLEVMWTLLPVLILVGIAVPSIDLIAKQYKPAPAKALTVKITGNQWFWTYSYPDNGEFEVNSYMLNLPGQAPINAGVREVGSEAWDGPAQLEVDNRMVVPAGEPIRLQVTAADVIHSVGVPSLWFKLDAVPGRINEKVLFIEKPGVYYGQCSELCGVKHAYMPIVIEALPREQFNAWVLTHSGGAIDGQKPANAVQAPETATPAGAAAPATNPTEAVPAAPTTASPSA